MRDRGDAAVSRSNNSNNVPRDSADSTDRRGRDNTVRTSGDAAVRRVAIALCVIAAARTQGEIAAMRER